MKAKEGLHGIFCFSSKCDNMSLNAAVSMRNFSSHSSAEVAPHVPATRRQNRKRRQEGKARVKAQYFPLERHYQTKPSSQKPRTRRQRQCLPRVICKLSDSEGQLFSALRCARIRTPRRACGIRRTYISTARRWQRAHPHKVALMGLQSHRVVKGGAWSLDMHDGCVMY